MNNSHLDASDKTINLQWAASVGEVSKYSVTVFDGSDFKYSGRIASTSTDISFNDIKNGHRYGVQITAFSQVYEWNQTVASDTYEGQIKTVVKGMYIGEK